MTTSASPSGLETVVINTGPIVALCVAGAAEIVGQLRLEFVAPPEVAAEIAAGQRLGHRVAMPEWVSVTSRAIGGGSGTEHAGRRRSGGHRAGPRAPHRAGSHEARGRRAATAAGLTVIGSLGLLGRAKADGLIPAVGPYVAAMRAGGVYLDAALIRRFLVAVGEVESGA